MYIGRRRVAARAYGNNTSMFYTYDGTYIRPDDFGVRQVVGTTHTFDPGGPNQAIIDNRTYTWDEMFNKTQRNDVRDSTTGQRPTHDYAYDPAYRMTQTTVTDTAAAGGPAVAGRDVQDRPWRWR